MQFDIRIAAHHAAGAAGGVEQNLVEQFIVPPLLRAGGIAGDQFGAEIEPLQIVLHPKQAAVVNIQAGERQLAAGGFQQVAAFAAGCGAGVENAHAGLGLQQFGAELGGFVLHARRAVFETGQFADVDGLGETDAVGGKRAGAGGQLGGSQLLQVSVAGLACRVVAQAQRGVAVVGGKNGLGLFGPGLNNRLMQPVRVGAGFGLAQVAKQGIAFALKTAQHGVGQALGPVFFQLAHRVNGGVDAGVIGNAHVVELVNPEAEQHMQIEVFVFHRLFDALAYHRVEQRVKAQGAVAQLAQQGALFEFDLLLPARQFPRQGLAVGDGLQAAGGRGADFRHGCLPVGCRERSVRPGR